MVQDLTEGNKNTLHPGMPNEIGSALYITAIMRETYDRRPEYGSGSIGITYRAERYHYCKELLNAIPRIYMSVVTKS